MRLRFISIQIQIYVLAVTVLVTLNGSVIHAAPRNCSELFGAFGKNGNHGPITSVVGLADGEMIPQQVFQEYDLRSVARSVIERVRLQELRHPELSLRDDQVDADLMTKSEIILFFDDANIAKVATRGFLNQHLSGSSRGSYGPEYRIPVEDGFTGIKMGSGEEALHLRPKSAFLNLTAPAEFGERHSFVDKKYGGVGAVLKNDVKDRSLWTAYDSYDLGAGRGQIAGDLSSNGLLPYRGTFRSGRISNSRVTSTNVSYYEAVIYGDVGFKDVSYFLISDPKQLEKLKPYGLPIYEMMSQKIFNRVIYQKGPIVFAGTPVPRD